MIGVIIRPNGLSILAAAALVFAAALCAPAAAQQTAPSGVAEFLDPATAAYAEELAARARGDERDPPTIALAAEQAAALSNWVAEARERELLAGASPNSARIWLDLASAWLRADRADERGALAAWRAAALASAPPARFEALVALSAVSVEQIGRLARQDRPRAARWRAVAAFALSQIEEIDVAAAGPSSGQPFDIEFFFGQGGGRDLTRPRYAIDGEATSRAVAAGGAPVYCVRFSEPVTRNVELIEQATTVRGQADRDPRIELSARGRELCLAGLQWRRIYDIEIGREFQSFAGAPLTADRRFTLVTPPAPPRIGFNNDKYLLPASGAGRVPIRTTNVESASVSIVRVSDRELLRRISLGEYRRRIEPKTLEQLEQDLFEPVWAGSIDVAGGGVADQTTFFDAGAKIDEWAALAAGASDADRAAAAERGFVFDPLRAAAGELTDPGAYAVIVRDLRPVAAARSGAQEAVSTLTTALPRNRDGEIDGWRWEGSPLAAGLPTQWLVRSDVALTLLTGPEQAIVLARALDTGEPAANFDVEVLARNGRILAKGVTDANGLAVFDRRVLSGSNATAFAVVTAVRAGAADSDQTFTFLEQSAARLDLSEIDMGPAAADGALDAFIETDRGVYQPGDELGLLAILRERSGRALSAPLPLRVRLKSARGFDILSQLWNTDGGLLRATVPATAPVGPATMTLSLGDAVLATQPLEIRHIRPNRASIAFDRDWRTERRDGVLHIEGRTRAVYNFGGGGPRSPVRDATVSGGVRIEAAQTPRPGCYAGYVFGDDRETPIASSRRLAAAGLSDEQGRVVLTGRLLDLPETSRPLAAMPTVAYATATGLVAEMAAENPIPIETSDVWIGVRQTPFSASSLARNRLDVDFVAAGSAAADVSRVRAFVEREQVDYVWSRASGGDWRYQVSTRAERVGQERIEAVTAPQRDADGCAAAQTLSFDIGTFEPGVYRVTLISEDGAAIASRRLVLGFNPDDRDVEKPELFRLSASSDAAAPGERVTLSVSDLAVAQGELLVGMFVGGQAVDWASTRIDAGAASPVAIALPADASGGQAHFFALAFGRSVGGPIGPTRAVGLTSIAINAEKKTTPLALSVRPVAPPDRPVSVTVAIPDARDRFTPEELAQFEAAVFAVDVGILDLTRHDYADPADHFYGPRAFGFDVQDLYGSLIRAFGDSGGDALLKFRPTNFGSQKLAAQVVGPVSFDANGEAVVELAPFEFTGAVRIAAFAWGGEHVGFAQTAPRRQEDATAPPPDSEVFDLEVGGPFELTVTPVAVLRPGDEITLQAQLAAASGDNVATAFDADVWIRSGDEAAALDFTAAQALEVRPDRPASASARLRALQPGDVEIGVRFTPKDAGARPIETVRRVTVRPFAPPRTRVRRIATLPPGGSLSAADIRAALPSGGAGETRLFLAPRRDAGVAALPVSPTEASVRSVEGLAAVGVLRALNAEAAEPRNENLDLIHALQRADGAFAKTPFADEDARDPLAVDLKHTAFALDFYTFLESNGQTIDPLRASRAESFLSNTLAVALEGKNYCVDGVFYAALTLARRNALPNFIYAQLTRDCARRTRTALSTVLLSSVALAVEVAPSAREKWVSEVAQVVEQDGARLSFETAAQSLAILAETRASEPLLRDMIQRVNQGFETETSVSVLTAAWLSRASEALDALFDGGTSPLAVAVAGLDGAMVGAAWRSAAFDRDGAGDISVSNNGRTPVDVFISTRKASAQRGRAPTMVARRRFFNAAGEEIGGDDGPSVARGELIYGHFEATLLPGPGDAALSDSYRLILPVPAGFAVERDFLTPDAVRAVFGDKLQVEGTPTYVEALPDRVLALILPKAQGGDAPGRPRRLALMFAARAGISGTLEAPEAVVEAISAPELFGETGPSRIVVRD